MIAYSHQKKNEAQQKNFLQIPCSSKQLFRQNYANNPETKEFKVFQWGKVSEAKQLKESNLSAKLKNKSNSKLYPTDSTHNLNTSKMHESIFFYKNTLHQKSHFQQPLSFRPKKLRGGALKKELKNSKIQSISIQLSQIKQLVRSQDKQVKMFKHSLSEQQLHRLIKIHSIQKLKLMQNINFFRGSSIKLSKRRQRNHF